MPLSAPGLVASAIFSCTLACNEFLLALVITMDQSTMTVLIKLTMLVVGNQYIWGQLAVVDSLSNGRIELDVGTW